ncbi:MAG: hypothetical protein Q4F79_00025 [Eubacteriales bacterium]|nr:hypothetical protein [Eubacteriales bacterium]
MKCKKCNGTGMVGLGDGIRGIKKCDACNGTGSVERYVKAIIFSRWFLAPDELDEFCRSIGYEKPDFPNDFNIMFDQRVVEFCEKRLSSLWDEMVYKGRDDPRFRIGFAGAGYIRNVDTSKTWRFRYNNVDAPIIDYIDVKVNDYGYLCVV